jgi:hypothetical protein
MPVRVVTGNDDWVVNETSAKGIYGQIDWQNVARSHVDLVKPRSTDDVVYQHASDFLSKCREWKPPEVLKKLRDQVDWMWQQHTGKLIRNWHFAFHVEQQTGLPRNGFGIAGFNCFKVNSCRYQTILAQEQVYLGFALGRITTDGLWNDSFVYLHRFLVGDLDAVTRDRITAAVRRTLNSSDGGWSALFQNLSVRLRSPNAAEWHTLQAGQPQRSGGDGVVSAFRVPPEAKKLIGNEVDLQVSFESIMPAEVQTFTVEFPWLCDGFRIEAAIQANSNYLGVSPFMTGSTLASVTPEDLGSVKKAMIASNELALPNSRIVI